MKTLKQRVGLFVVKYVIYPQILLLSLPFRYSRPRGCFHLDVMYRATFPWQVFFKWAEGEKAYNKNMQTDFEICSLDWMVEEIQ